MGIPGNEKADRAAKSALLTDIMPFKVPFTDMKPVVNDFLKTTLQDAWSENINNKLYSVKPILGDWLPAYRRDRREEVVLSRIRIGHTRLTHGHLMAKEVAPECIPCYAPYTIEHLFIHCVDVAPLRDKYFKVQSMKDLFDTVSVDMILTFLKEINIYKRI